MSYSYSYSTWYCDDHLSIVANNHKRIGAHKFYLRKAIQHQNNFEKSRGIVNCVAKSKITPVSGQLKEPILGFPATPPQSSTKILGLNIKTSSFTAHHIEVQVKRARQIITGMYSLQGLDIAAKLHLTKMLIISILTYPCTPLNTASISGILKLQATLNKSLNFAYNNRWSRQNFVSARTLHDRANIIPINQILHIRAAKVWDKIAAGISADEEYFDMISNLPFNKPHKNFASSYIRACKDLPPPLYTNRYRYYPDMQTYYNT